MAKEIVLKVLEVQKLPTLSEDHKIKVAKYTNDFAAYRAPFKYNSGIVITTKNISNIDKFIRDLKDATHVMKKASDKFKRISNDGKETIEITLSQFTYPDNVIYADGVKKIVDNVAADDPAFKKHKTVVILISVVVVLLLLTAVILLILWKKGRIFKKKSLSGDSNA